MEADAPPPPEPGHVLSRMEPWLPWLLAGLALLLRTVAAARAELVHNDSILYMDMARLFYEGDWTGALAVVYHPAPSALMALFRAVIPDMVSAGYAASVLLSSLAVFPLYRFGKSLFGTAAGALAAVTYAALPGFVLFGSSVLSEGPYFLFFALALWAFHESLRKPRWWPAAVGGAAAGLAYLCRPEGGGLLVVFLGVALFRAAAGLRREQGSARAPLLAAGLACAAFAVVALPYIVHLRHESGRWRITKKKKVTELVGVEEATDREDRARERLSGASAPAPPPPAARAAPPLGPGPPPRYELPENDRARPGLLRAAASLWEALHVVIQVLFYIPGLIGVVALLLWRRLPRSGGAPGLPLLVLGFYLALCALFHFSFHYLSDRHLCGPALAFLPFVGAGVCLLARSAARALGRVRGRERDPVLAVTVVLAAVLVGASLPKGLSAFGLRKAYYRQVGEALAVGEGPGHAIVSTEMRLPLYARGRYVPMPDRDGLANLRRAMDGGGARLVALNYSSDAFLRDYPEVAAAFWASLPAGFERAGVFDLKKNGRPLVVLRRAGKGAP